MAEYLATRITQKQFGNKVALEHRQNFLDIYFRIRAQSTGELPLIDAKLQQDYTNYQKGGLALFALSEYMGEQQFNTSLAAFEEQYRYKKPPYPTSLDFVSHLAQSVPDSLQYLIRDLFETITIHDNKINEITWDKIGAEYHINIDLSVAKYRSDGSGRKIFSENKEASFSYQNMESLPLADYFELGLYDEQGDLLRLIPFKATEIHQVISVKLDQLPAKIILDPNLLTFDMDQNDNVWNKNKY